MGRGGIDVRWRRAAEEGMKSNKINWFQVQGETMRMGGVTAKERFRLGWSLVEKKIDARVIFIDRDGFRSKYS